MKQECISLINENNKKMNVSIYDAVKDGNKKIEKKLQEEQKKKKDEGEGELVELIEKISEKQKLKAKLDEFG